MPALTFTDHEAFHRTAIRTVLGAALGGLLTYAVALFGVSLPETFLPVALGVGAACGKGWRETLAACVAGALCGGIPALASAHPWFSLVALGAGTGLIFVYARRRELAAEGAAGKPRPGRAAVIASAVTGGLLAAAGGGTVAAFQSHNLFEAAVPPFLAAGLEWATFGLFIGLGASGAHIVPDPDPVEALFSKIEGELAGDLRSLALRAVTHYRRCAEVLLQSPAGPARLEMSRALTDVTTRILQLARKWQSIDREMGERAAGDVEKRLEELRTLRDNTKDEAARRQLQVAERTLHEEMTQIDRINRGRERVVARLHADMAILECTRFALLGLRSSDAHLRTAELASLSENLTSIAKEMDTESEAMDEVISQAVNGLPKRQQIRA
jgi:hypothetical protein